ncbi:hypothetical protein MJO28_017225 [Puccinia striiformis f. sp. tritici]|nr:hypothetical protein MJO28_017225 [Puccinia striiformis f. sp. tritici]
MSQAFSLTNSPTAQRSTSASPFTSILRCLTKTHVSAGPITVGPTYHYQTGEWNSSQWVFPSTLSTPVNQLIKQSDGTSVRPSNIKFAMSSQEYVATADRLDRTTQVIGRVNT